MHVLVMELSKIDILIPIILYIFNFKIIKYKMKCIISIKLNYYCNRYSLSCPQNWDFV